MNFLDLFAGIGGFRLGMEQAEHECVGHVEWDKFARISYKAIHRPKEDEFDREDITKITDEEWRTLRGRMGGNVMKKIILILLVLTILLVGCSQAEKVSLNLSKEADNFNVVRQLTVINCIQGDVLFQMTGKFSIVSDEESNELQVVVEVEEGKYKKHFIGLGNNTSYVVEDITGKNVSNYRYTLNFNPKMWIPIDFKTIE